MCSGWKETAFYRAQSLYKFNTAKNREPVTHKRYKPSYTSTPVFKVCLLISPWQKQIVCSPWWGTGCNQAQCSCSRLSSVTCRGWLKWVSVLLGRSVECSKYEKSGSPSMCVKLQLHEKSKISRPVQCSAYVWQFYVGKLKTKEVHFFFFIRTQSIFSWDEIFNLNDEDMASTKENG